MRLLIVSHTPHYNDQGVLKGWGPTVREIDQLANLFDEVVHVAPLHKEAAPESALPYESARVRLCPVPPAGGARLSDKLAILRLLPVYARTILNELRAADAAHVRCPSNISLIAVVLLSFLRSPRARWIKYAGNWKPASRESLSYAFQRRWLRFPMHRGAVTVNGKWPGQPAHVHAFFNPSLTDEELIESRSAGLAKQLDAPIKLLFVGRLEEEKGVARALKIAAMLDSKQVPVTLDLVGDGPQRDEFENLARQLGIASLTTFHGWLARAALAPIYSKSHILLLPTRCSEGWPKVLSEAMAYGVVPVSSNVSCITQYLDEFGAGRAHEYGDLNSFAETIAVYLSDPERWKRESMNGTRAARYFSYSFHLDSVRRILNLSEQVDARQRKTGETDRLRLME